MKTIFKYKIDGVGENKHEMSIGAIPLSVINQNDELFVYMLVDDELDTETRKFSIYGTGWGMPDQLAVDNIFIGTVTTNHEMLVWHVFVDKGDRFL